MFAAAAMDAAGDGAPASDDAADAAAALRILTPLLKLRACRDNVRVATAAMEIRGGNGYIEEWVNARLVRDAHIGVLWEGTSNIVALDVVTRAAAKENAHRALQRSLHRMLDQSSPPAPELVAAARDEPRSRGRGGHARRRRRRQRNAGAPRRERALPRGERGVVAVGGRAAGRRRGRASRPARRPGAALAARAARSAGGRR